MPYPRRGDRPFTRAAGAPQNAASDEALIELVQSLPLIWDSVQELAR